jgi:hypothetical protein
MHATAAANCFIVHSRRNFRAGTISDPTLGPKRASCRGDAKSTAEPSGARAVPPGQQMREKSMNGIIYLVGLVVVIVAILSFFGLR